MPQTEAAQYMKQVRPPFDTQSKPAAAAAVLNGNLNLLLSHFVPCANTGFFHFISGSLFALLFITDSLPAIPLNVPK